MEELGLDLIIKRLWDLGMMGMTLMAKADNQRSCGPSPTCCSFDFPTPRPWKDDKVQNKRVCGYNFSLILYQTSLACSRYFGIGASVGMEQGG